MFRVIPDDIGEARELAVDFARLPELLRDCEIVAKYVRDNVDCLCRSSGPQGRAEGGVAGDGPGILPNGNAAFG